MLYKPASREIKHGDIALLDEWRRYPDSLIWADFSGETLAQQKHILIEKFDIHPMAIQDAQRERHPPKLEAFDDHVFILLKGLGKEMIEFEFETIQIAMFIGERFLVTRHSDHSPSIDKLRSEIDQDHGKFSQGTDVLALRLARIIVDRYLNKLLTLESRLEELEQKMNAEPGDNMLTELTGYKTNLRKFRRVFLYHVQIFSRLATRQFPGISATHIHEINDVFENQERANSLATLYYELCSDLIEGYISLASHRLNNIIKILTIITAIFVPLSFLAGVYGMNFENMPELHSKAGYFILLSVMGLIVVLLLFLFRRMRWI